ncbi:hypothetical protein ACFVW9_13105 [Streptomyces sp. NPDC058217]|uniref:hypothetical protein n=1 Tax=Streptomyces sp. NPDC058217 TaxID=3346384 RepID=UPI0036E6671D
MGRRRSGGPVRLLAAALLLLLGGCRIGMSDDVPPPPPRAGAWSIDYVGPPGQVHMSDLAAVSATEAWAVTEERGAADRWKPGLLRLLDGRWSAVQIPAQLRAQPWLRLAAAGPRNVWLYPDAWGGVPPQRSGDAPSGPWKRCPALHWDGTRWHQVPLDFPPVDLDVVSPDDAWALDASGAARHWDGTRWRTVPLPARGIDIEARAADDVWVAGDQAFDDRPKQPAAVHWDGSGWQLTRLRRYQAPYDAKVVDNGSILWGIRAESASDAWALGVHSVVDGRDEDREEPRDVDERILLHWSGTRWQPMPGPPRPFRDKTYGQAVPDGTGGMLLGAWAYRTAEGTYFRIDAPPNTEGWQETSLPPLRRRWLTMVEADVIPGTHTILAAADLVGHDSAMQPAVIRLTPDAP